MRTVGMLLSVASLVLCLAARTMGGAVLPATEIEKQDAPMEALDAGWRLFIQKGKIREARAKFEAAAKSAPEHLLVRLALASMDMEQGRNRQALGRLVDALRANPWSPWLEVMLADAVELLPYAEDPEPLLQALTRRLQREELSWLEAARIRLALARIYVRLGRVAEARKLMAEAPVARTWLVIGPFNNRDRSGFPETHALEETLPRLDFAATSQGRGRSVGWLRVPARWDGKLDLGAALYPGQESLAFACVFVEAKAETEATLALGSAGATALWVNGVKLHTDDVYHDYGALQRLIPVKLKAGLNQIVIKVAGERGGQSALCLRVLPLSPSALVEQGSSAKVDESLVLTVAPDQVAAYDPAAQAADPKADAAEVRDWGAMAFFSQVLKQSPFDALALVSQGYLTLIYGLDDAKHTRSRPLLDKAARAWPRCPLAQEIAALVQPEENRSRMFLERAVEASPDAVAAQEMLLERLQRGGFRREAETRARTLVAAHPSAAAWRVLGDVEQSRGWKPEAYAAYQKAVALAPRWSRLYLDLADSAPGDDEELRLLRQGLAQAPNRVLESRVQSHLRKRQRFDEIVALCEAALKREPFAVDVWLGLAAAKRARGDTEGALAVCEEALKQLPQSPGLLERTGCLQLEAGHRDEAITRFHQALTIKVDNPQLAEYLKQLEPQRERFYAAHDIPFAELNGKEATPESYPRHNKVVLLDQGYVRVNPNGTQRMMIHWVVKVLRRRAIREESLHSVSYDPERQRVEVVRARVIQPDGTVIDNPTIGDHAYGGGRGPSAVYTGSYRVKSIRLPQVKEGCIVDLQYTVEDTRENVYADEFEDGFFVGSLDPTLRFAYTADLPESMKVHYGQAGTDLKPQETVKDDRRILTWQAEGLEGVEVEPRMPPHGEVVPPLRLSSFADWDAVAKWVWNLSEEQMELPEDIQAQVQEITKDCKTREEKIAAIYYYITEKIRYVSISYGTFGCKPHKAERTFRARYGDCKDTAVLFCAMLQTVGIESRFVLVRTLDRGKERTGIPGRGGFNHAIAYVPPEKEGGKHYWLDGTTDYFTFGDIPFMDRDTVALVVGPEGGKRITIDPDKPEHNVHENHTAIRLAAGGVATLAVKESYRGAFTPGLRRQLETPERLKQGLEFGLGRRFPGSRFVSMEHSGTDIRKPTSWLSFTVADAVVAQAEGGAMKFCPALSPLRLSRHFAAQRERHHPMLLGFPYQHRVVVEIHLPPGAALESLPKDVKLDHPCASYTRIATKTKTGARIETQLVLKARRLAAKDYPAFKEFCHAVDNADEERVVYREARKVGETEPVAPKPAARPPAEEAAE